MKMRLSGWLAAGLVAAAFIGAARGETIQVSAAISLKEAVTEIAKTYKEKTGDEVVFAFGSSGQLLTQIKNGAEVDAFISAADKQVDDLEKAGLAEAPTRRIVARNTLVLIVPPGGKGPESFEALKSVSGKVAIGEPKTVPAGDYAMQTLTALKLVDSLKDKLVYGANVRQVLIYVERGEVDAGMVYLTDAKESGAKVKVAATADEATHGAIVYPAVVVKGSKHAAGAGRFLDYLATEKAQAVFAAKGFKPAKTAERAAGTQTTMPGK
jgi:molybdate transport system substrate-binding protein